MTDDPSPETGDSEDGNRTTREPQAATGGGTHLESTETHGRLEAENQALRDRVDDLEATLADMRDELAELKSARNGNEVNEPSEASEATDATRELMTQGGSPTKVIGRLSDDGGIGVLGEATGSGETVGVKGMVGSTSGYGLHTPDDAEIEGVLEVTDIDTAGSNFTVEAGTTATGEAGNVFLGHSSNSGLSNGGTIGGGGFDNGSTDDSNDCVGSFPVVGGGRNNLAAGNYVTISGGRDHTTDNGAPEYATIGGGYNNEAGGLIGSGTNQAHTVAGGKDNKAIDEGATVGGGEGNKADGGFATVAGGQINRGQSSNATVGGGIGNTASGEAATVGGGGGNTASGRDATVGGGDANTASGEDATVGGGFNNTASGEDATVPGGTWGAAEDDNSFVWNDASGFHSIPNSSSFGLSSDTAVDGEPVTGSNTFSVGATGGVRFITGSSSVTHINGGSTGWSTTSSRAAKTNIDPVDPRDVLAGVRELEVATWEYENEDNGGAGTTHIGPMAEDFHDIVDVGSSDDHINAVNADGVLFAAVQGLSEKLERKDGRIDDLEAENERLRDRLSTVEDHLGLGRAEEPAPADE